MTQRGMIFFALGVMVSLVAALWTAQRHNTAKRQLMHAQVALQNTLADANEIRELRSSQQTVQFAQRPTKDVIAQVNAVLADVGIPASAHFKGLTPESDSVINSSKGISAESRTDGGQLRQQSLRLALEGVTVSDIGKFLHRWRQTQPVWTPTRIELVHSRTGVNAYDLTVLISTLYLAEP